MDFICEKTKQNVLLGCVLQMFLPAYIKSHILLALICVCVCVQFSPCLDQLDGWRGQQSVRQQVDLLHDVGQTDGQLLTEEDEGRALAGVGGAWREVSVTT